MTRTDERRVTRLRLRFGGPLQLVQQIARRLPTVVRIFGETFLNNAIEWAWGERLDRRNRRWIRMHDRCNQTRLRRSLERLLAGQHLVQLLFGGAALLVAILAVPATLYFVQPAPERLVTRLDIAVPANTDPLSFALSPNGRQLAFVATSPEIPQIWLRALDQTTASPLRGTDRASEPFWAPDGRAIAFFADGKLKRIDLSGGPLQTIADAPVGRGGTWSPDGTIVFAPTTASGLMRVASTGGTPVSVTNVGPSQEGHFWPHFLPDGRHFLFFAGGRNTENSAVYVGSLDGGDPIRLLAAEFPGVYAPPNWLLVVRGGTLMAVPFDPTRGAITGDPAPVAQAIGLNPFSLSVSTNGVMTYLSASVSQRRQLVWRDRTGRIVSTVGQADETDMASIALAPDGRHIATSRRTQGNADVWLIDVNGASRLTFNAGLDNAPVWSADGQWVVFRSTRNGLYDLFKKPAGGAGDEQPLLVTAQDKVAYDSSADGRTLLYGTLGPQTSADILALPLAGDHKPFPVVQTSFEEDSAQFSPNGRWIAYESNETGRFEIYVQAFPRARGKWQISRDGGIHPRWRVDGKELFYIAADGRLMALSIIIGFNGQSIEASAPVALFTPRLASGPGILAPGQLARPLYAIAPDGRFLLNEAAEDTATTSVTVVLNWHEELKRRVPTTAN